MYHPSKEAGMKNIQQVKDNLNVLKRSCAEGKSGEWDCSTKEGREGFDDMITIIERIEKDLE